jgi:uncharacterized membrane-anchored protein
MRCMRGRQKPLLCRRGSHIWRSSATLRNATMPGEWCVISRAVLMCSRLCRALSTTRADLGPFRLKWERHTEFARYQFIVADEDGEPFARPAVSAAPADWVAALAGESLVATHVGLMQSVALSDYEVISTKYFNGNTLVGAVLSEGVATALTDFRIHHDGFSRILVLDRRMSSRQAGRMVQRLLEVDTNRMMALLALPVARDLAPLLTRGEQELAKITAALVSANAENEPLLLDRLTRLGAEIDSREAASHYRFSAAGAYYELVEHRIADLREDRIEGLQLFQGFTQRGWRRR